MSAFVFYILFVIESVEKREVTDAEVFFACQNLFLLPNQQHHSSEGERHLISFVSRIYVNLILICLVTVCQMYAAIAVKH